MAWTANVNFSQCHKKQLLIRYVTGCATTFLQVFDMLKAACKAVLSAYTSLQHDEEVLQQCSADACMQAALSWRITYKR